MHTGVHDPHCAGLSAWPRTRFMIILYISVFYVCFLGLDGGHAQPICAWPPSIPLYLHLAFCDPVFSPFLHFLGDLLIYL